jgi:hypothetical protein
MVEDYLKGDAEIERENINSLNLHAGIGYFSAAYSKVELAITVLLAALTKNEDYEAFHVLTRGMDLRIKIERLRELCKPLSLIEDKSALDMRLLLLAGKICTLRNKLSHSYIGIPDAGVLELGLSTIMGLRPISKNATTELLNLEALEIYTDWCESFFHDLLDLTPLAKKRAKFSIGHPHSVSPTEFHHSLDQQSRSARLDRLRRTRDKIP